MMARRRSGIKVYRAEAGKTKRDRESLSLFALQSAALIILMVFWWNAFLSVFRLPFDVRRLYAGTAGAVLLLGVLNRYRGAAALAAESINISDMTNKSRDKFAYTMVDVEQRADEETVERIRRIDGVLRVRVL